MLGFLLILNAWGFALIKENPDQTEKKAINYFKYIREIPHALKTNKTYATAILGNCFHAIANVALSFYTLNAIRNFEIGAEQIALFAGIGVLVNIFGSAIFGVIGDKIGHRHVLMITATLGIIAPVLALSIHSLTMIYISFAMSSLASGGYSLSSGVNIINHSPEAEVPLYVSMNTMLTFIASSVVTLIAGALIDIFSFSPLFVFTAVSGFISLLIFRSSDRGKDVIQVNRKGK